LGDVLRAKGKTIRQCVLFVKGLRPKLLGEKISFFGGGCTWLEEKREAKEQMWLFSLFVSARLGRRFAPLVNPNPLSPYDERVEEKLVTIVVHVPIARPSSPSELASLIRLPSR